MLSSENAGETSRSPLPGRTGLMTGEVGGKAVPGDPAAPPMMDGGLFDFPIRLAHAGMEPATEAAKVLSPDRRRASVVWMLPRVSVETLLPLMLARSQSFCVEVVRPLDEPSPRYLRICRALPLDEGGGFALS